MVTSPLLYIPLTATQLNHIRKTTRQDNDMPRRLGNKRCSICDRHSYALMPNSCILFVSFSHTTLPHQDFPIVSVFLCGLWQMGMKWKCSLAFFLSVMSQSKISYRVQGNQVRVFNLFNFFLALILSLLCSFLSSPYIWFICSFLFTLSVCFRFAAV